MSRWFRMYEEILDDPKVQRLEGDLYKFWVNILALTSRNNGILPDAEDCAFALRLSLDDTLAALIALEAVGLLKRKNKRLYPNGWEKRQYKSDSSTLRVKRFRKRCSNGDETPSETDTETDTESDKSPPVCAPPVKEAVECWNAVAAQHGLPMVHRLTDARKRSLVVRLGEVGGIEGWREVLARIPESGFLLGENDRGWRADFDFVLQAKSFTKLREGGYSGRGPPAKADMRRAALDTLAEMDRQCPSPMEPEPLLKLVSS